MGRTRTVRSVVDAPHQLAPVGLALHIEQLARDVARTLNHVICEHTPGDGMSTWMEVARRVAPASLLDADGAGWIAAVDADYVVTCPAPPARPWLAEYTLDGWWGRPGYRARALCLTDPDDIALARAALTVHHGEDGARSYLREYAEQELHAVRCARRSLDEVLARQEHEKAEAVRVAHALGQSWAEIAELLGNRSTSTVRRIAAAAE